MKEEVKLKSNVELFHLFTFESFNNNLRHLEVLEAANQAVASIGTSADGNECLNFIILFAQLYGTSCEEWMDLETSIKLAQLYATEENDFQTFTVLAENGPVTYFNQEEYKKIAVRQKKLENEGWVLFVKQEYLTTKTDDTFDYKERLFDFIFYRHKILNVEKINKVNQKTGVFEKLNNDINFRDVYNGLRNAVNIETCQTIATALRDNGFNIIWDKDTPWDILVNGVPMHLVNNYELRFDNDKIYNLGDRGPVRKSNVKPAKSSFATNNPEVFQTLQKNGLDSGIGGPSFTRLSEVTRFFQENLLNFHMNPVIKNIGKTGVWEKD